MNGEHQAAATGVSGTLGIEVVAHHLRLFGIRWEHLRQAGDIKIMICPDRTEIGASRAALSAGTVVIAVTPMPDFCAAWGVENGASNGHAPKVLQFRAEPRPAWSRLRTLFASQSFRCPAGEAVVADDSGTAAWLWVREGPGGILFVGTALADDLVRYRQGDPALADAGRARVLWDIPGERPNHLFEAQREGEAAWERHADHWAMALAGIVADKTGCDLEPILPNGAPGAIVATGDDDQAYLEKYRDQLDLLGDTPVTYFLHPLTRHTRATLGSILARPDIDLGLHPDALDYPQSYGDLLGEQVAWYRALVGTAPLSVRNHGFLSDGYWGHLPHWLRHGIRISSNIPGFDGTVLNGSLLPARVAYDGVLTEHWSILTALGDGLVFAGRRSQEQAAECVHLAARRIRESGIPGVLVVNLHPQNVQEAHGMHLAVLALIEEGFLAWTIRDCLAWFCCRDGSAPPVGTTRAGRGLLAHIGRGLARVHETFAQLAR
jgi:hypothetical protein